MFDFMITLFVFALCLAIYFFISYLVKQKKKNALLLAKKNQTACILYRNIQDMLTNFDKDCLYPDDRFNFIERYINQHYFIYKNSELLKHLRDAWLAKHKEVFRKIESEVSIEYKNFPAEKSRLATI